MIAAVEIITNQEKTMSQINDLQDAQTRLSGAVDRLLPAVSAEIKQLADQLANGAAIDTAVPQLRTLADRLDGATKDLTADDAAAPAPAPSPAPAPADPGTPTQPATPDEPTPGA